MKECFDFGIVYYISDTYEEGVKITLVKNNYMKDMEERPDKVVLPEKINGNTVVRIGEEAFFNYECEELFLPIKVKLDPRAFHRSLIAKIHIPGVKMIPSNCFAYSYLKELADCNDVICVEEKAFLFTTELEFFEWFPNCSTIPRKCFAFSGINYISNINNVSFISIDAFRGSRLKEIDIPDKCSLSSGCFSYTPISKISAGESLTLNTSEFVGCKCEKIKLIGCERVVLHVVPHTLPNEDIFEVGFDSVLVKIPKPPF